MKTSAITNCPRVVLAALALFAISSTPAADWPMLGRDATHNAVSPEKGAPVEWDMKTGRNIKWRATIGSWGNFAPPAVANGLVWMGTSNWPEEKKDVVRAGILHCFRESDGKPLYQHVSPQQKGPTHRWAEIGTTSCPLLDGDRLWFVTTSARAVCLDIGPLRRGQSDPRELWQVDFIKDLGVHPYAPFMGGAQMCSFTAPLGNLLFVSTGNGVAHGYMKIVAPQAPALVCLDKRTGKLIWEDHSSGTNIIYGEWGNPTVITVNGRAQVVAPQGDGWLRSFEAATGKLIWKFDINPKNWKQKKEMHLNNHFIGAPVFHQGRLYAGGGQEAERGEGPGRLVCIDPTKTGDISLELDDGPGKGKANPNSGALWHLDEFDRTLSSVVVHEGLVVATDFSGYLYCLDAATGRKHWRHDLRAHTWSSPLVVDGKIYVADEDGDVEVFELSREKKLLFSCNMERPVYASPIFANGVLYLSTDGTLFAIQRGTSSPPPPKPVKK